MILLDSPTNLAFRNTRSGRIFRNALGCLVVCLYQKSSQKQDFHFSCFLFPISHLFLVLPPFSPYQSQRCFVRQGIQGFSVRVALGAHLSVIPLPTCLSSVHRARHKDGRTISVGRYCGDVSSAAELSAGNFIRRHFTSVQLHSCCVCVWVRACVRVCACMRVFVCVCVRACLCLCRCFVHAHAHLRLELIHFANCCCSVHRCRRMQEPGVGGGGGDHRGQGQGVWDETLKCWCSSGSGRRQSASPITKIRCVDPPFPFLRDGGGP